MEFKIHADTYMINLKLHENHIFYKGMSSRNKASHKPLSCSALLSQHPDISAVASSAGHGVRSWDESLRLGYIIPQHISIRINLIRKQLHSI